MNKPTCFATREELKEFFAKGAPDKGCSYLPIGTACFRTWFAVMSKLDGRPYVRVAYLYGNDVNDFSDGNGWDGAMLDGDDCYFDGGLTCWGKDFDGLAEWALARLALIAKQAE